MKDQKHMPAHMKFYRRDNFDDLRGKTKEDVINDIKKRGDESLAEFSKELREAAKLLGNGKRRQKTKRKKRGET